MDVTKTIQELLLSNDKNNNIIASEILKTCPILIDTTFYTKDFSFKTRGDGNKEYTNEIHNIYSTYYYKKLEKHENGNGRGDGYRMIYNFIHLNNRITIRRPTSFTVISAV
jgi:hypothetical protein